MIKAMFLAGLGGAIGTCLRYLTGRLCNLFVVGGFPLATFVVNVVGSLFIGLLFGFGERHHAFSPAASALLITGFCGGFTTFSSFANDIYMLLQGRHWPMLIFYALLSLVLGVGMVCLGRWLMKG